MEVDYFLIEQDRSTRIHRTELQAGRLSVIPKLTLRGIARGEKLKSVPVAKGYDTFIHTSNNGKRYAVAIAGGDFSSTDIDELIAASHPKPLPLT